MAKGKIAERHNVGKLEWCLLPMSTVAEIVKVLMFGARKYSPDNWKLGNPWTDTYNSLVRHLNAWREGEDRDPDSGCLHLGHIGCNVVFLTYYYLNGLGTDDRSSPILRNRRLK